ncbi:MAG: hypothetical protein KAX31_05140 [Thermoplasmata archaeon]|nr:hypothetical protein [Thermoplasmata archaeon]
MLFVTIVNAPSGKYEETVRALKRLKIPENIVVKEFLGLFGEPDALIVFEAPDESAAVNFIGTLASYVNCKTHLALPIEEFRWTR